MAFRNRTFTLSYPKSATSNLISFRHEADIFMLHKAQAAVLICILLFMKLKKIINNDQQ